MESNWAVENLQTIRTLMERSALYRRALAPSMFCIGIIGLVGAGIGQMVSFNTGIRFTAFWCVVCLVAGAVAFFIIRRQAVKEAEPFWTPPTRRVAMALSAPFFSAAVISLCICMAMMGNDDELVSPLLVSFWLIFYGCGLCSAGFFVVRGVRVLGWLFILAGLAVFWRFTAGLKTGPTQALNAHFLMALTFGGLHVASGIYLYFTEKRKNEA